jgi:hypothetical protein
LHQQTRCQSWLGTNSFDFQTKKIISFRNLAKANISDQRRASNWLYRRNNQSGNRRLRDECVRDEPSTEKRVSNRSYGRHPTLARAINFLIREDAEQTQHRNRRTVNPLAELYLKS